MYTIEAEKAARVKIRKDGEESAITWALQLIDAPVAPAGQRAIAYAIYDLTIVNKE